MRGDHKSSGQAMRRVRAMGESIKHSTKKGDLAFGQVPFLNGDGI